MDTEPEVVAEAAPRKRKKKKVEAPLYGLKPAVEHAIVEAAHAGDAKRVRRLIHPLHYSDVADLLERLSNEDRQRVVEYTRRTLAPEVLSELDDSVRDAVIDQLDDRYLAAAVRGLETDDAVEILEDLDDRRVEEVLEDIGEEDRQAIEAGLAYPEDSAGRLMQRDYVAIAQSWTVGKTIDYMRESDDLPVDFYDIFVVDGRTRRLVGQLPLNKLLRSRRAVPVRLIMEPDVTSVPATMDQEDVALLFRDRDLVSAPVVDEDGRLVGMITVDDVLDVITEEAEEDLLKMHRMGRTDLYFGAARTARNRIQWLLITLVNTILASIVISQFQNTIGEFVALAVLMPIVAAMGGNAGMQVVTVTVRAISMRELYGENAKRLILKEILVGATNGLAFAAIMGAVAGVWFESWLLGGVLAAAMLFNMLWSGLAGTLIPLTLARIGVDPAVAAGPLLTTTTDVLGFFIFLGLATLVLL